MVTSIVASSPVIRVNGFVQKCWETTKDSAVTRILFTISSRPVSQTHRLPSGSLKP
nr:hypothetical protein [Amycolatopsis sp.]